MPRETFLLRSTATSQMKIFIQVQIFCLKDCFSVSPLRCLSLFEAQPLPKWNFSFKFKFFAWKTVSLSLPLRCLSLSTLPLRSTTPYQMKIFIQVQIFCLKDCLSLSVVSPSPKYAGMKFSFNPNFLSIQILSSNTRILYYIWFNLLSQTCLVNAFDWEKGWRNWLMWYKA